MAVLLTIRANIPHFTSQIVEHSRSLLPVEPPIYKLSMKEVRSGADSPGHEPLVPMIGADLLHGSPKSVEVGPKLPPA